MRVPTEKKNIGTETRDVVYRPSTEIYFPSGRSVSTAVRFYAPEGDTFKSVSLSGIRMIKATDGIKPYEIISSNSTEIVVTFIRYANRAKEKTYYVPSDVEYTITVNAITTKYETYFKVKFNGTEYNKIKLNGTIITPKA